MTESPYFSKLATSNARVVELVDTLVLGTSAQKA
jgi:hypothetical protein